MSIFLYLCGVALQCYIVENEMQTRDINNLRGFVYVALWPLYTLLTFVLYGYELLTRKDF